MSTFDIVITCRGCLPYLKLSFPKHGFELELFRLEKIVLPLTSQLGYLP